MSGRSRTTATPHPPLSLDFINTYFNQQAIDDDHDLPTPRTRTWSMVSSGPALKTPGKRANDVRLSYTWTDLCEAPIPILKRDSTGSTGSMSPGSPRSPTSTCPKCGLRRRPSLVNVIEMGGCSPPRSRHYPPISAARNGFPHKYHWPTDECCEDWCPDTIMPQGVYSSVASARRSDDPRRRHNRRRSSLCVTESMFDESEGLDEPYEENPKISDKQRSNNNRKSTRSVFDKSERQYQDDGYRSGGVVVQARNRSARDLAL